jgi:serine/threonine protein phosphatase PrpC
VITFGNAQTQGARQSQEDYFAIFPANGSQCAVVADGMGGHVAGAVASELAVKSFREFLLRHAEEFTADIPALLERALEHANHAIADWVAENQAYEGMGTTLVAACIGDRQMFHISVGDSPFYRLRSGSLTRINQNHAFAETLQEAVLEGEISAAEAASHPDRSVITSALCGEAVREIDVPGEGETLQPGDSFLLASDGIHTLSDDEIGQIMSAAPNAQRAADRLIAAVEASGLPHQDNTTVVIMHVLEERVTQPLRSRAD